MSVPTKPPLWHIRSYDPVGHCIYCHSTSDLSDEHIIPFGLLPKWGDWVLPKASCGECRKITKKFEGSVQQTMLGPLREKLGLKTRRRPKKKYTREVHHRDGTVERRELSADDLPAICIGFGWQAPGLLRGVAPSNDLAGKIVFRYPEGELARKADPNDAAIQFGRAYPMDFARMLAKIAHVGGIAEHGQSSFTPALPDLILGRDLMLSSYLVGGDTTERPEDEQVLHNIYRQDCRIQGVHYMMMAIRLFAFMGMPRYHIIVGKKTDQSPPTLPY